MPQTLPNSFAMEQALLGAAMVFPYVMANCAELDLDKDEFYDSRHKKIYGAMQDLYEKGTPIEPTTVVERLETKEQLNQSGGADYIAELMDHAVSGASVKNYIENIKNKSQIRQLIDTAQKIADNSYSSPDDIDSILDYAERSVMDVTRNRRGTEFMSSQTVLEKVIHELESLKNSDSKVTGIATGLAVDEMTNGFQRGDLIILAARPAMGKSALALNFANRAAQFNPGAVAIFSLEMPAESLMKRLLASESQVSSSKLRTGELTDDEMSFIYEAANRLSARKIYIDDTSSIKVSQIFSKCRKLKAEEGSLSMILIDYLQLITGPASANGSRQQEVSDISRNLKILAKELDCPVIALSQLSRKVEERTDHEPMLSDLRESGSIEQDADIVMFLYREAYYDKEQESELETEEVKLSLAKHRNGAIGEKILHFEKAYSLFH